MEMFTGEGSENSLDDWLPTLVRAVKWNSDEFLIQLAGHLKGQAHQEWSLMTESDKTKYERSACVCVHYMLGWSPEVRQWQHKIFWHASQEENEKASDFIRRLESTFNPGVIYSYPRNRSTG